MTTVANKRIIILGGGFAGIKCAKTLRKLISAKDHEIVVFNRENHMVFHPLLAEVVGGVIQPKDVAAPLRQLLPGVHCRTEEVLNIDLEKSQVEYEAYDGKRAQMQYDQLVIAGGNKVNLGLVPGMDDHAFPLKTIGDAIALQAHVMEQLEKAEVCDCLDKKRHYLSFIIVGGGFSGVETAGEINSLVRRSSKYFGNINPQDISVTIVHGRDQLLPEVSTSLREFARTRLEKSGVRIWLNAMAAHATSAGITLKDGRTLSGATIVFTAGMTSLPIIQRLSVPKTNGRLSTEPDMSLPGYANVWAIGDCASIINADDGKACPPVGQFAERQGKQAAHNIAARLSGKPTKPFAYRMLAQLCAIGGFDAVAELLNLRIAGFPAWFLWRSIYLMKLPSFAQKFKVGLEWGCDLLFPRTLAHLKADRSQSVCRAYYAAGDTIFQQDDPASDFFIIQQGEVEIIKRPDTGGTPEIVAILGAGDFFGEGALISSHARTATVRARTETEVIILGRNVFTQISAALTPLRDAVAKAAKRRTNIWKNLHEIRSVLDAMPTRLLMEPLPDQPVGPACRLGETTSRINKHRLDFCCVVEENKGLVGIITRSDLLRAIEVAAALPEGAELNINASDIMVRNPIAITIDESAALAVMTMREHGLKSLPVVDNHEARTVKGYLRIENIMDNLMQQLVVYEQNAGTMQQARVTKQLKKPIAAGDLRKLEK